MKTKIFEIDESKSYEELLENPYLKECANIIKKGGTVAFPTETVYGLGANANDELASEKIYKAKKRASDNPLIVHISDFEMLKDVVKNVNKKSEILMKNYFPGPLTLILQKNDKIAKNTCSHLETVGVRMPENKIARAFIKLCAVPIAAPSANISGKPSPTKAQHVIDDLNSRVNAIICARNSKIGIESTIVDCTKEIPVILRPGAITYEMLNTHFKVEKNINVFDNIKNNDILNKPIAPGMKYRHYKPETPVYLIPLGSKKEDIKFAKEILENQGKKILFINEDNPKILANIIFKEFRNADLMNYDYIFVTEVEKNGIGQGVMNRIYKAINGDIYDIIENFKGPSEYLIL